jgi:mannose/fructose-specific phosphotransferase system component IIA
VVVCHGQLAQALVDAVREIVGEDGGLVAISNEGCSTEELERRIAPQLEGDAPIVVFSDLPSGSCTFAARHLARARGEVGVVGGVNLPMLLDFVFHRTWALPDLLERLRSKTGIVVDRLPPANADRPVSGR